jgi:O-antigen/teichoic acid export membrane protein
MINFFKNPTYSSWVYTLTRSALLLGLTALVLIKFNKEEITLWYLFSAIIGFSHLMDLGFSSTIIRFTSYLRVKENNGYLIKSLFNAFSSIYIILSISVFLILIVVYFISVSPLKLNQIDKTELNIAYSSILFFTPIIFFLKKNDSFLKGYNKVALYNNWNSVLYVINALVLITLLLINCKFYILIIVQQALLLINSIKNFFLVKKNILEGLSFFQFNWDKNKLLEIWKPTWKTALISLSSTGSASFINIMAPRLFGLEIGGIYLFSMKLIQIINEFSYAPFYSYLPEYISSFKKGFTQKNKKKVEIGILKSLFLLVIGIIALDLMVNLILTFFDIEMRFLSSDIVKFIVIAIILERYAGMNSQIIMFDNNINHFVAYIMSSIILISGIISFKSYGLIIIPFSGIAAFLFLNISIAKKSRKTIEFSRNRMNKQFALVVLIAIVGSLIINS